jgi:bifunctional UDP-N-acetylglucosamine pyrophosphorylase / glucosamine-1-phosphate N-acetyltransferase
MHLNIVILAAGEGKRLCSALPKVLHQIGGVPMLERVVITALSLKPNNIYVIYSKSQVKQALSHLQAKWVLQSTQIGTGHAVLQALPHLNTYSQTLILCGDIPLLTSDLLEQLINTTSPQEIGMIVANLDQPEGFGRIIRNSKDKIISIIEQKDATKEQLAIKEINSGIFLMPTMLLKKYLPKLSNKNNQKEYYLTDVVSLAVKNRYPITSITATNSNEILGVNNRLQLATLERYYQQSMVKKLLLSGVTLLDPNRFDLRGEVTAGKDVTIDINVIISGKVIIGNNTKIDSNVILHNAKIGNNVHIKPNTIIEDAIIEENCIVGPFARIRPGSKIKARARVGNFVEIKNTELGNNSKASHLTYLGDTTIGKDVNIGAGTITVNYDGVNKHRTIIEDGAFIGSNSQLIAPVTIGKNATIGAGSTITENAPPNQLTLGRAKQCTIKNWQRPKFKKTQDPAVKPQDDGQIVRTRLVSGQNVERCGKYKKKR